MKKSKQSYRDQSNCIVAFAAEHLEKSNPEDIVKFSEAYDLYRHFCQTEGYEKIYGKTKLRSTLKEMGYHIEKSTRHNNQLYFIGARLIEEPDTLS